MSCNIKDISPKNEDTATRNSFLESEPFEFCRDIIAPSRKGVYGGVDFNNGLMIYFMNLQIDASSKDMVEKVNFESFFGFRFCISGRKKIKSPVFKNEIIIKQNHCDMFSFPEEQYRHEYVPNSNLRIFYIFVKPAFLSSLLGNDLKNLMPRINPSSNEYRGEPFHFSNVTTPAMQICLHQIFNCPYSGSARKFYFESKSMELIAHKLALLEVQNHTKTSPLKSIDIERMHYAGELLKQDCQNPPKIIDLVKKIGTSRTKFFTEFRQVHGLSPSAYLRCSRMEKAKNILENQSMNVAEIATYLGFSSSSHFTRTFKQYYGISPGLYSKKY